MHRKPARAFCGRILVDPLELRRGIVVEGEHTRDVKDRARARRLQHKIACDHLLEVPDYYTRLNKLEAEAKRYWGRR